MRTRDLADEAVVFTGVRLLTIAIGLVLTPFIIESLGLELFGVWALLTAVVAYLSVADLGLGPALVRFVAASFADGDIHTICKLITVGVGAFLVIGVPVTLAVWGGADWLIRIFDISPASRDVAATVLILMTAYVFLAQSADVLNGVVLSTGRAAPAAFVQAASHLAYAATVIVVLTNGGGLIALVAANFARLPIVAGASYLIVRRRLGQVLTTDLTASRSVFARLARFGGWIQLNSVARLVSVQTDAILIGALIGPVAVGAYDIGRRPAFAARALPLGTLPAVFPKATELYQRQDRAALEVLLERSTKLLSLATLSLFGLLAATSSKLLDVWIGKDVPEASHSVLLLLLAGYGVNTLTGTFTTFLRAMERPQLEVRYAWLGTGLNIALTIVLGPWLGLEGVVIATVIANTVASVYLLSVFASATALGFNAATSRWRLPLLKSVTIVMAVTAAVTAALPESWFESRVSGIAALGLIAAGYVALLWLALNVTRFPGFTGLFVRPNAETNSTVDI